MKFLIDDHYPTTLGEIAADNPDMDTRDLNDLLRRLQALAPGESLTEGGGAGAEWKATRVDAQNGASK